MAAIPETEVSEILEGVGFYKVERGSASRDSLIHGFKLQDMSKK